MDIYQTPGGSWKGHIKYGLSILPSFHPYFHPSFCLCWHFLGIISLSSKFWHGARSLYNIRHGRGRFSGNFFCPRNWEKDQKIGQKQGFLNLLKNLVINFYLICSKMKNYIICCVPAQIPYLGKFCSWDMGQNVLSQSDCRIFSTTISLKQINEIA